MEVVKGYTQGRGCGYGLLSLAKEFEFVCSQREFFMGGLTQGPWSLTMTLDWMLKL